MYKLSKIVIIVSFVVLVLCNYAFASKAMRSGNLYMQQAAQTKDPQERELLYNKAIENYLIELGKVPNNSEAHIKIAEAYTYGPKNYKEAYKHLASAYSLNPKGFDQNTKDLFMKVAFNAGREYYQNGKSIKDSCDIETDNKCLKDVVNEYKNSIECFEKATEINPKWMQIWASLAMVYGDMAITDTANYKVYEGKMESAYNKAVELKPKEPTNYINAAAFYYNRGMFEKAIPWLKKAPNPDTLNISVTLADCYVRLKMCDEALALLEQILSKNPENDKVREVLKANLDRCAMASFDKGDFPKAIELYNKLLNLDPQNKDVYFNLALTYEKNNELEKAIDNYKKFINFNPDSKDALDAHFGIYSLYQKLNKEKESNDELKVISNYRIGDVTTKKFHTLNCNLLPAEENKVYFSDRTTAISNGYKPDEKCKP